MASKFRKQSPSFGFLIQHYFGLTAANHGLNYHIAWSTGGWRLLAKIELLESTSSYWFVSCVVTSVKVAPNLYPHESIICSCMLAHEFNSLVLKKKTRWKPINFFYKNDHSKLPIKNFISWQSVSSLNFDLKDEEGLLEWPDLLSQGLDRIRALTTSQGQFSHASCTEYRLIDNLGNKITKHLIRTTSTHTVSPLASFCLIFQNNNYIIFCSGNQSTLHIIRTGVV